MIGTAFLAATLMVNASATETLKNSIGSNYSTADLVISGDYSAAAEAGDDEKSSTYALGAKALKTVEGTAGVSASHGGETLGVSVNTGSKTYYAVMQVNPADARLNTTVLETGALPSNGEQVTVDATYAKEYNISIGDVLNLQSTTSEDKEISREVKVSGITASSNDPMTGSVMNLSVVPALFQTFSGGDETSFDYIIVAADAGTNLQTLKGSLATALEATGLKHLNVNTADEQITQDIATFSGGEDQLTIVLLVFALIALVVTGLVVMNTFAVLIAQRTRELALMRTLGALRKQIRSSVLIEALLVGLIASAAGVLLATGIMAGLIAILAATVPEMSFAVLAVSPQAIIVPILAGTLITLIAAWVPARKAMSVAPLAALRPADDATVSNKAGKIRIVFGLLLVLSGAAALAYGAIKGDILIAFGGGMLSFPGVLMLGSLFLPKTVSAIGSLTSGGTVPGKLASLNAVRNPGRTTATATALLIGVTLVSMMMVGAQTAKASLNEALGSEYLVDVEVIDYGMSKEYNADQLQKVKQLKGVESLAELTRVGSSASGQEVFATDPQNLKTVLNSTNQVPGVGEVLVSGGNDGKTMSVRAGYNEDGAETGTKAELKMLISESNSLQPVVGWDTAEQKLGITPANVSKEMGINAGSILWLKVDDSLSSADLRTLQSDIASALNVEEYAVGGGVMEKQMFNTVIDMLLMIVSGLLAVAVLIALIGVANTLSLSVLERTRENSLLRALGLTRGQLKKMLATEAVLIGGVAALLGVVLGSVYGLLGAQSVMGAFGAMSISIPWLQLAGVIAVSVVAALAASVVPARRAAKLAPVQGLASE
ncbi:hypothetical protein CQ018_13020 [Arthrobacter sp. MYb227]|uniref:ABC transporter permease n=1 Tax=Arthrobacter sp. MYb227 TaxID=1848601 RepID=UPI000D47CCF6|nr:ABC transporter permease [Arthrobacter sp. MYb227]PQZ91562.1 hypothetical protein CQ018_13020 [Arthrobacter sp. MYb227]